MPNGCWFWLVVCVTQNICIFKKATNASGERAEVKKTKTTKKTVVLVFLIAVLTVSLICLAGAHYNLQRDYDHLSKGFEFIKRDNVRLVNERWIDNTGTDSKYVNFKVGVLNIGYGKSYNVITVSGGDEQIEFRIEDPFRTIIYNDTVKYGLDFTFTAEIEGSYSLEFQNLQSESGKTIAITRQRIVTRGLDTTLIGAGVIIVIMIGLGLFKMIFPERIKDIDT